jgi:short subunit dehydrogenase-like uncharacterized protein
MMSEGDRERRSVVIFGATGVTGQMVLENALDRWPGDQLVIAGRSLSKLNDVITKIKTLLPAHSASLDKVLTKEADVASYKSLVQMCQSARVVLNCVGPFRFYGEEVVKAALEARTHYLDISGEPYFLESMEEKYSDAAKSRGVYIIGSCGFDSIPADVGLNFLRDNFPGELTGVEAYLTGTSGPSGYVVNFGTWQSLIHGFANEAQLRSFRKSRDLTSIKYYGPSLKNLGGYHYVPTLGYCVPFAGADRSVVARSQRSLSEIHKISPVRFKPYMAIGGLHNLLLLIIWGVSFGLLAKYSFTRRLLEMFPRLFSFGRFSKSGPTRKQMTESTFTWHLKGQGFISTFERDNETKATVTAASVFSGPDAGYIGTSRMLCDAALTVLDEPDKLPPGGGVFTPGAAFSRTGLVNRLQQSGFTVQLDESQA